MNALDVTDSPELAARDSQHGLVSRIVEILRADKRRDIYEAKYPKGEYWITYQGGGPFPYSVIMQMFNSGMLARKYENCECYQLAANAKSSHAGLKAHD